MDNHLISARNFLNLLKDMNDLISIQELVQVLESVPASTDVDCEFLARLADEVLKNG